MNRFETRKRSAFDAYSSSNSYSGLFRERGDDEGQHSNGEASPTDEDGSGLRLSDRLYELSLEAEVEEKRQQRAAAHQVC